LSKTVGSVTRLLFGIVLFVGLPLLGWGVPDIPGFAGNPVRLPYVEVAALLQVLIVIKMPDVGRNRGEGKEVGGSFRFFTEARRVRGVGV